MLSPAMTLYGGFGPAYLNAGRAAPLAFVWALFATLPTALSYVFLSNGHPNSGSAAAWAEKAFSRRVSIWAGWMVFLYYLTNFIIQPVTLGVFAGDLFKLIHIEPGFITYGLGALLCLGWTAPLVYKGIGISMKSALAFLLFESLVVVALCTTVVWMAHASGTKLTLEGFYLSASPAGASGIFRAMVFAILAYCGFDVVSTLAEETHMPEKLIPRATILSLFVYATVITLGIWALTFGSSPGHLKTIAESGLMPITEVARIAWGKASFLIPLTAISASLGLAIATSLGASRVLFSMARSELAPARFSQLNSSQIPGPAIQAIFVIGAFASLVTGALMGPFDSYVWWGTTSTFFALVTYLVVNGANIVLHWRRAFESTLSILMYILIPILGIVFDLYLLYRTFFLELWKQGWATGQSVVVFDLSCCAIAAIVALKKAPIK